MLCLIKQTLAVVAGLLLTFGLLAGLVHGREDLQPKQAQAVHIASAGAEFEEVVPGVSKSILWGNHDDGPYGAFTRFIPGLDNGMHLHSHDVRIVVIEGVYIYRDDAGEMRVGPGEFISIPAGKVHRSGGDAEKGALFYEESDGGFDFISQE